MKLKLDRQDTLFIVGALLIVMGIAIHHPAVACSVAGVFLLLPPLLELISSFIRGLRN